MKKKATKKQATMVADIMERAESGQVTPLEVAILADKAQLLGGASERAPEDRQQRLSRRRSELDADLRALDAEIEAAPDGDERLRMRQQAMVMRQYSEILGARIAAF